MDQGIYGRTYTTICLRPSNGLRMNLRVRRVTSAMFATFDDVVVEIS